MTKKTKPFITDLEDPNYLATLGTFIARFAQVEAVLNEAVRYFSMLDQQRKVASAIFGALRVDESLNLLTRLVEARNLRGKDIIELRVLIEQIRKIARTRNEIVHLGAEGYGRLEVTNRPYVHTKNRTRVSVVSAATIEKMDNDLVEIFIRLTLIIKSPPPGESMRVLRGDYPFLDGTQPSWLYTPQVRVPHRQKPRAKRPRSRQAKAPGK